jgi:hypothetical protein
MLAQMNLLPAAQKNPVQYDLQGGGGGEEGMTSRF